MGNVGTANASLEKLQAFCRLTPQKKLPVEFEGALPLKPWGVEKDLAHIFPMTKELLGESLWNQLITSFSAESQGRVPKDFSSFVKARQRDQKSEPPYLSDLLDFEGMVHEIGIKPIREVTGYYTQGDLMQDILMINPDHALSVYSYPVFSLQKLQEAASLSSYPLLCFRPLKADQVCFISLSSFYATVLELVIQGGVTGKMTIQQAAEKLGVRITPDLYEEGRGFFQALLSYEAILGFQE